MFDGVLRQRGLVALDVQELPPLTALLVEHEHALMVGSHPHEALRVVAHLPDEHVLRHIFIALGPHQFRQRRVPSLLILHINIGTHGVRNYPKVLVFVSGHPIIVIGIQGVLHVGILPQHLTLLAIDAHQFAEGRYEHHTLLRLGISRYTKVLRELIWPVAESEVLEVLSHGVEIVETVLIALHPIVLLRVEVDALHTAEHTPLVQPVRRVSVHLLRHRVVHRIVHTLFQPQPAAVTFLDLVDAVVTQRGCVLVITEIGTDAVTIIAIQTIVGTEPHVTLRVTENTENFGVRQALTGVDTTESHVRNDCGFCHNRDAKHRQDNRKTFHYNLLHYRVFVIFIVQRYTLYFIYANFSSKIFRPTLFLFVFKLFSYSLIQL